MSSITPELYEFIIKVVDEKVKEIKVSREAFDRLTKEIRKLAEAITKLTEAEKLTEERVDRLSKALEALAEAQKQTEKRVNELAEAQKRTEERIDRLSKALEALAEAQKQTEERLNKLTKTVDSLVVSVRELSESVKELRVEVGRLGETVGFGLEDIARVVLPGWLQRHLNVYVDELRREFFVVDGEEVEVNLFGEGVRDGRKVVVVGEVKSRIYGHEVDSFYSRKYSRVKKVFPRMEVIGVLFGYLIHPSAKERAKKYGFYTVASYER